MSVALQEESFKIRSKMALLRRHLHKDARLIAANTTQLLDWRDYARQFPKAIVASGLLAGFIFGPGHKVVRSVKLTQESIDDLLSQRQLLTDLSAPPKPSFTSVALRVLSGIALSGASVLLRKGVENYFSGPQKSIGSDTVTPFGRN